MKQTGFYFWLIPDERRPGKMRKTTYRMTEKTAQERHPGAMKVEGSEELRWTPETEEDLLRLLPTKPPQRGP